MTHPHPVDDLIDVAQTDLVNGLQEERPEDSAAAQLIVQGLEAVREGNLERARQLTEQAIDAYDPDELSESYEQEYALFDGLTQWMAHLTGSEYADTTWSPELCPVDLPEANALTP